MALRLKALTMAGLILSASGLPSFAEAIGPQRAPNLSGHWTFKTEPYRNGVCTMRGSLTLIEDYGTSGYACELTAVETCNPQGESIVLQSCNVSQNGQELTIRSEVIDLLQEKPGSTGYVPDHFVLTIDSQSEMNGQLVSAVQAPVRFSKETAGIS